MTINCVPNRTLYNLNGDVTKHEAQTNFKRPEHELEWRPIFGIICVRLGGLL